MTARSTAVLRRVIRLAAGSDRLAPSDRELLDRFATAGDQQAFTELVRRHTPMVLGVCRRALGHAQDAEDACQATFVVLARKARSGRWQPSIANWLYTTARRLAANARLAAQRRARREGRAAVAEAVQPVDRVSGRELLAALDEELERLPARYREALVLCYLEGLTRDEAAARLGVPAATVKTHLERGRKRLANALTKRGVVPGAALLALAVTSPAGASSPRLVEAILASVSGSPPHTVALLVEGLSMHGVMCKSVMALVVVGTALGLGMWVAPPAAVQDSKPDRAISAVAANPPREAGEAATFTGRVIGPDGKPVAGAQLLVVPWSGRGDGFPPVSASDRTGADGRFGFSVARAKLLERRYGSEVAIGLVATAPGYFPGWTEGREGVTIRLAREDARVTGRVTNLEGRPVAGATVRITAAFAPLAGTLEPWLAALEAPRKDRPALLERVYFGSGVSANVLPGVTLTARTDAQGRFELAGYGKDRLLRAVVEGPGIATRSISFVTRDMGAKGFAVSEAEVPYYGTAGTLAAAPSRPITGVVRDQRTRQPLAGVTVKSLVMAGSALVGNTLVQTTTGPDGRFTLDGMPKGAGNVILATPDVKQPYLAARADVPDPPGVAAVTIDIGLTRGVLIEGVVRDQDGKPVPLAWVHYFADESNERAILEAAHFAGNLGRKVLPTGPDGRFSVVGLPGKGHLVASVQGHRYLAAGERAGEGSAGRTTLPTFGFRIRADSCNAAYAIDVPPIAASFRRDVVLQTGRAVTVNLVGPDGKPVTGAQSFARAAGEQWQPETRPGQHRIEAFNPKRPRTVLFRHQPSGLVGVLKLPADFTGRSHVVTMRPGLTVTGRVLDEDGKPLAGAVVTLRILWARQDDAAQAWAVMTAENERITTDAQGRFQIGGVPPGFSYAMTVKSQFVSVFRTGAAAGSKDLGDLRLRQGVD